MHKYCRKCSYLKIKIIVELPINPTSHQHKKGKLPTNLHELLTLSERVDELECQRAIMRFFTNTQILSQVLLFKN